MVIQPLKQAILLLHGGAGTLRFDPEAQSRHHQREEVLATILAKAYTLYLQGYSALDIVEFCVRQMEDSPLFNAGIGSVLTDSGWVEMDASIMDGQSQRAGAVALIRRLRHPITAARYVMEHTPYVFLAGSDAEQWLIAQGLEQIDPAALITTERYQQWQKQKRQSLDHTAESETNTVGAVAIDRSGALAAATSTGGMMRKPAGRIGDSAVIGAGTYANSTCAISTTGEGEFFIRSVAAHSIAAARELQQKTLLQSVERYLLTLTKLGGSGGVIAISAQEGVWGYNATGMYRGALLQNGIRIIATGDDLTELHPSTEKDV